MISGPRDVNFIPSKLAVLNTDTVQGKNLVAIKIDSSTGKILATSTDTISFVMKPVSPKDPNYVNCWMFEGSDGKSYPAVANASGELLINT